MPVRSPKRTWLILAVIALSLVLLLSLALAAMLRARQEASVPQTLPTEQTEPAEQTTVPPTTQPTEPTLPPPEANPYHFTDFQYDGRYRVCLAAPTLVGIDVSYHQKQIDWQAVADSGVDFVILRVGYRGYKTGLIQEDELAQYNYEEAKKAGLKVGAYFFSQAVSVEEALEEAQFLLDTVAEWEVEMPLVYDWEHKGADSRTYNLDSRIVTDCAIAFCDTVAAAGYDPMVYFNPHHAKRFFHLEELVAYPFWLAYYTDRMQYSYKVKMWQYTSTGTVPGIGTDVDINLWFVED